MSNLILFSCVGKSDPVRDMFDGPLLHIVRHYRPGKVYLYYTKEVADSRENIVKSLEPFNVQIDEVFSSIEDAHDFDIYIKDFSDIIARINDENDGCELLLNVSSGTPQMISTLCMEVVTSKFKLKPVQVSTPSKSSNAGKSFGGELCDNFDDPMVCGQDTYPNRCIEPDILSFRRGALKRDIISLVENFEYRAAGEKAKGNKHLLNNEDVISLIEFAKLRQNDNRDYKKSKWNNDFDFTKDVNASDACDYYCILNNKEKTGELSYFVLLLKPLVEFIAKNYIGDIDDSKANEILVKYYRDENKGEYKATKVKEGKKYRFTYNIEQLIALMKGFNKDMGDIIKFEEILPSQLRETRNDLAHTLCRIDKIDAKKILKKTEELLRLVFGNKIKNDSLRVYDRINEKISLLI